MKYNLEEKNDQTKAKEYLQYLIEKGKTIDITAKRKKRTLQQNKYIHVLFSIYGLEYGYTVKESKTMIKRLCPFMMYEKNKTKFLKETSTLNTKEMTDFIDWFRTYSGKNGLYLPSPMEYLTNSIEIDNLIESNREFL